MLEPDHLMLITRQPRLVCEAFAWDGSVPPHRDRTDEIGFIAPERKIMDRYSKHKRLQEDG